MARELRNISGSVLWVDTGRGGLQKVVADGIVTVSSDDERYWQTGEQGEPALWAEASGKSKKSSSTPTNSPKDEEKQ